MFEIYVSKIVNGGQGLGELPSGQKVFVWGALPGERVRARIYKRKRGYAEAITEEVLEASPARIPPKQPDYLATSPWQIMDLATENEYKKNIVSELFNGANVDLPLTGQVTSVGPTWHYRNKMEYSFWGDEHGLHLALFLRGTHRKHSVQDSALAMLAIDRAAIAVRDQLSQKNVRASDLKTVVVRCNQAGATIAALFIKTETFPNLILPAGLKGLRVYYSDFRSPASVPTRLLQELGDPRLHDDLLGKDFVYDVESFFQVNIPIFESALRRIAEKCMLNESITDMYAGVGSIGLSVANKKIDLVELDSASAAMARVNAARSGLQAQVYETSTEKGLDYILPNQPIIFDPPRAGLHKKVAQRTLAILPPQVIYMSCNPATQVRDLGLLQQSYAIEYFEIFNFFPRTPHIETLAILTRKTKYDK